MMAAFRNGIAKASLEKAPKFARIKAEASE
jgi:hypothetical protein